MGRDLNKIRTENVFPPIPTRLFDWCATYDGYEPGDPIGWGATKDAAIKDLLDEFPPLMGSQR